jgi:hypothetical protein
MLALLAVLCIAIGLTLVLADEKLALRTGRNPESGAAMSRMLGMILLVGGGLMYLTWTR